MDRIQTSDENTLWLTGIARATRIIRFPADGSTTFCTVLQLRVVVVVFGFYKKNNTIVLILETNVK